MTYENSARSGQSGKSYETLTPMEVLEQAGKLLMQRTIDMALAGDVTALRLCVERLWPPRRGRAITLGEPKMLIKPRTKFFMPAQLAN